MTRADQSRLRSVPLFSHLNGRELRAVLETARELEFAPGEEIVTEGLLASDFYLLLDGEAAVTRRGRRLRTLVEGDTFGEMALLGGGRRTASVSARTRVRVLRLDARAFGRLLRADPSIARKLLVELAGRLRKLEERVLD